MSSTKTWKASVWLLGPEEREEIFYGSSLVDVREKVSVWLIDEKPSEFSNIPSNHEISRRYTYTQATEESPLKPGGGLFSINEDQPITSGWVGIDGSDRTWTDYVHFESIQEVSKHFVKSSIQIQKGPDWKEIEIIENQIPLHLIHTVKKIKNEDDLNDHLQSGWYLLSINYSGSQSYDGKLESRRSEYIIGHPEENADLSVLPK